MLVGAGEQTSRASTGAWWSVGSLSPFPPPHPTPPTSTLHSCSRSHGGTSFGKGALLASSRDTRCRPAIGMAQHDEGTPSVIYHVVQQSAWDAAQAAGEYFPPRYDKDGFVHATHEAAPLLGKTHRPGSSRAVLPRPEAPVRPSAAFVPQSRVGRLGPAGQPWSLVDNPPKRRPPGPPGAAARRAQLQAPDARLHPPRDQGVLQPRIHPSVPPCSDGAPRAHGRRPSSASPSTRRCSRRP